MQTVDIILDLPGPRPGFRLGTIILRVPHDQAWPLHFKIEHVWPRPTTRKGPGRAFVTHRIRETPT